MIVQVVTDPTSFEWEVPDDYDPNDPENRKALWPYVQLAQASPTWHCVMA